MFPEKAGLKVGVPSSVSHSLGVELILPPLIYLRDLSGKRAKVEVVLLGSPLKHGQYS